MLEGLQLLRSLSIASVDLGIAEPLEQAIRHHEQAEAASTVRFVVEELQFARGCLALIRGDSAAALDLLQPLPRQSYGAARRRVLARAYEALDRPREAALEYEQTLENPRERWGDVERILDQFRAARLFDRLGDAERARHWYEEFLTDWKDADPDITEVIEARRRLQEMGVAVPQPDRPPGAAAGAASGGTDSR